MDYAGKIIVFVPTEGARNYFPVDQCPLVVLIIAMQN